MSSLTIAKSRRRRPWLQFTLRTLLLVTLLLSIPCSWFAVKRKQVLDQRRAIASIRKIVFEGGGNVGYEYEMYVGYDYQTSDFVLGPPGPAWLRRLLGDDAFAQPVVDWTYGDLRDVDLGCLKALPNLKRLFLRSSQFNEADLVHLSGLKKLVHLDLGITLVSDAGLAHLQDCTQLEQLFLDNTRVTDAGLAYLAGFTNLRELYLCDNGPDFVPGPQITDKGLEHLKGLRNLEVLYLDGMRVTDAGLVHLRALKRLECLYLRGTGVSDAGLGHLQALPSLQDVFIWDTEVTDAGAKRFREARPKVRFIHEVWPSEEY